MNPARRSSGREGVALVIVLGTLSLMLIMAAAFAISMRTERLAAGNYADTVRTRQLLQAGLARALDDIRGQLGSNLNAAGSLVYPPWTVTNSYYDAYVKWENSNKNQLLAGMVTNSATNFIPRALWADVLAADGDNPEKHWIEIKASNVVAVVNGTNIVETNLMGRVKYLILNCSSLLDANYAGGTNRAGGVLPAEIDVAGLPEIGAGADNLVAVRQGDDDPYVEPFYRYETVEELHEFGYNSHPSNFFIYSYFPAGYWNAADGRTAQVVNLGGTTLELQGRRPEIIVAFTNAGLGITSVLTGARSGILYTNLLDYVDPGSRPQGDLKTGVERVPMIYEIAVSNRVLESVAEPGKYDSHAAVYIKWWYPFAAPPTAAEGVGVTFSVGCESVTTLYAGAFSGPLPQAPPIPPDPPFVPAPGQMGLRTINLLSNPLPVGQDSVDFKTVLNSIEIRRHEGGDPSGQVVDQVATITITNFSRPVGQASWSNRECIDPRFNYNPADTVHQWAFGSNSLSPVVRTNAATLDYWQAHPDCDGSNGVPMHVADAPLVSAAELGALACAPWQTVKLLGPDLHPVLTFFGVGTNNDPYLSGARRGLVNPNTLEFQFEALAGVFLDMPVDDYPGQSGAARVSLESARMLAERLYYAGAGRFTNLADLGRDWTNFSGLAEADGDPITVRSKLRRESFLRNSIGLLSVRQNLFTIILEAQMASAGGIYPRNLSFHRAVAVVWRDPYTGDFFIRSFQWLQD